MKKLLLALALTAVSATSMAQDFLCDAHYKVKIDNGMDKVLVADVGDQFAVYMLQNGHTMGKPKISPALNGKGYGAYGPYEFMRMEDGGYAFAQYNNTNHVFATNCKPAPTGYLEQAMGNEKEYFAGLRKAAEPEEELHAGAAVDMLGDMARKELRKATHVFTGDTVDDKGNLVEKVTMERSADGAIVVTLSDGQKFSFINDDMDSGKEGTYFESRADISFFTADNEYHSVTNTKLVK